RFASTNAPSTACGLGRYRGSMSSIAVMNHQNASTATNTPPWSRRLRRLRRDRPRRAAFITRSELLLASVAPDAADGAGTASTVRAPSFMARLSSTSSAGLLGRHYPAITLPGLLTTECPADVGLHSEILG